MLVELNTQTVIWWRRSRDPDTLWLEHGEAALIVTQDRAIAIEHGRTVTLGSGAFNLRKTAGRLEVLSMSLSAQTAGPWLSAGAVTVVTDGTVVVRPLSSGKRDRAKVWRRN